MSEGGPEMSARRTITSIVYLSSSLACGGGVLPALAQSAAAVEAAPSGDALEEITVTAQKRVERLSDTTVSAAVVNSDTLIKSGVSTLDDLGKAVPSLTTAPSAGSNRSSFAMRGISTNVVTAGAPSGVAIMVDGVTLAPESMGARQLNDVANVEVLRGPQATLGGRTASAGVVNLVTRSPSNTLTGDFGATFTEDNEQRLQAFFAGPITQQLAFSLSAFGNSTEYPTRNLATGADDRERAYGGRGKLRYTPIDDLDITFSAGASNTKDRGTFASYIQIDPNALFRGNPKLPQSVTLPGITVNSTNRDYNVISSPYPGMDGTDRFYSMVLNYHFSGFTLS